MEISVGSAYRLEFGDKFIIETLGQRRRGDAGTAAAGRRRRRRGKCAGGAHELCDQRDRPGRRAAGVRVGRQDGAGVGRDERRF